MKDKLIRATGSNGAIKLVAVITTEATNEAKRRHYLSYLSTVLLGRAMGAGLLLASSMKIKHGRVTVKFQSDGPLNGLFVDAGRDGTVRGYVGNPNLELDLTKRENKSPYFDFQTATGKGYLHVTRDNGTGEPFTSTVELSSGGVGEDIASYLMHSEQIESAIYVGEVIKNRKLVCSGALMVQVFPQDIRNESHIDILKKECSQINDFSAKLYESKDDIKMLLSNLFPNLITEVLDSKEEYQDINFRCRCSKERSINALRILGIDELKDILTKEKESELNCKFCNQTYKISESEIKSIVSELNK